VRGRALRHLLHSIALVADEPIRIRNPSRPVFVARSAVAPARVRL
jgi:hypothetical protein